VKSEKAELMVDNCQVHCVGESAVLPKLFRDSRLRGPAVLSDERLAQRKMSRQGLTF
jgi:hypothetical protein